MHEYAYSVFEMYHVRFVVQFPCAHASGVLPARQGSAHDPASKHVEPAEANVTPMTRQDSRGRSGEIIECSSPGLAPRADCKVPLEQTSRAKGLGSFGFHWGQDCIMPPQMRLSIWGGTGNRLINARLIWDG